MLKTISILLLGALAIAAHAQAYVFVGSHSENIPPRTLETSIQTTTQANEHVHIHEDGLIAQDVWGDNEGCPWHDPYVTKYSPDIDWTHMPVHMRMVAVTIDAEGIIPTAGTSYWGVIHVGAVDSYEIWKMPGFDPGSNPGGMEPGSPGSSDTIEFVRRRFWESPTGTASLGL